MKIIKLVSIDFYFIFLFSFQLINNINKLKSPNIKKTYHHVAAIQTDRKFDSNYLSLYETILDGGCGGDVVARFSINFPVFSAINLPELFIPFETLPKNVFAK